MTVKELLDEFGPPDNIETFETSREWTFVSPYCTLSVKLNRTDRDILRAYITDPTFRKRVDEQLCLDGLKAKAREAPSG